jgi:hypothetical protein
MKRSRIATISLAVGLAAAFAVVGSAPANGQATLGVLYALNWSGGKLSSIDPATAVMTEVYQTSPAIGGSAAMYVDPVSLQLVVPTWGTSPWPVYSIDPAAGSQTLVTATAKKTTAAAVTPSENYVAYDIAGLSTGPSQLATIVSSTGAITDVAALTLISAPVRVSALAYCSGTLYGFTYSDNESVFEVNQTTGVLTRLSTGVLTSGTILAADCTDEGTLYAVDGSKLYKSSSATVPLTSVASLSGSFTGSLETMAVASTGSAPPAPAAAPLPDTGFGVETALVTGLVAAALTAAGIVLVTRRRARA